MFQVENNPCGYFVVWFSIVVACSELIADDRWPQFRGTGGQGHSNQADLPLQFDLQKGVRWRTEIQGQGWSSPVVSDGKIWVTSAATRTERDAADLRKKKQVKPGDVVADSVTFYAVCIDFETGKILHNVELASSNDPQPINPLNTYASPTPVLDGDRVYCHFGNYGTWCLSAATGETIWHDQIELDYGVGPGSSPIVYDNLLILVCDACDQQFVTALEKTTGASVWKTPRPPLRTKSDEMRKSFSTPIVIDVEGKKQIVVPCAQWIAGYEPETGREIWRIDHGDGFSLGVTPVFANGMVIFSTGYMRPELVAVRPTGHGDVTQSHVVWRFNRGAPNKPSPIVVGDQVYVIADNGVLTQLNVADGGEVWRHRLGAEYSASPIAAGERIYFLAHDGTISVIKPGPEFQLLAENKLEPRLLASPAVSGKSLLIRSEQALFRIEE